MGTDEHDLRAFLHSGDDEPLDADAVIVRAQSQRRARRVRVGSIAAATVLVAGVGTGAYALTQRGSERPPSAGGPAIVHPITLSGPVLPSGRPAPGSAPPGSTPPDSTPPGNAPPDNAAPRHDRVGPYATCPASPPTVMAPGAGGTSQSASKQPLFDGQVTSLQLCGYGSSAPGAGRFVGMSVLDGARAAELAASLNHAPVRPGIAACPLGPVRRLVVYARTSTGAADPVLVDLGACHRTVTNGTAVRYDWRPPSSAAALIHALVTAPASASTPHMHASPVR